MRRTLIGSTVLLAAALALTGCASGAGAAGDYDVSGGGEAAPMEPGFVEQSGGDGALESDGSSVDVVDRQVIINGNVTITADDPIDASKEAVRIVESAGGRIDGRTEYAATDHASAGAFDGLR